MYWIEDIATILFIGIISISILILCSAGAYHIVKSTNNPEIYKTYTINGNVLKPLKEIKGEK